MTCPATEPLTIRNNAGVIGEGFLRCLLPEGHDPPHETILPTILPDGGQPHLFQNHEAKPVRKIGFLMPRTHERIRSDSLMAEAFESVKDRFNAALDRAHRDTEKDAPPTEVDGA